MPTVASNTRATLARPEQATSPARSDFLRFVHLQCLRRTERMVKQVNGVRIDPNPAGIHDLRVAARRLVYTLDCFSTVLNPDRAANFRKRVKAILSAARPVRDIDVALDLASASQQTAECSLPDTLRQRRDGAVRTMGERLCRKRLQHLTQRWLGVASAAPTTGSAEGTAANGRAPTLLPWMADRSIAANASHVLPVMAAEFFRFGNVVCSKNASPEKLHAFRLKGKRLRYSLELFGNVYGPSLDSRLRTLKDVQRRLGVLSDCDATTALLRSVELPNDADSGRLLAFLGQRQEDATESFLTYWKECLSDPNCEREWKDYLALSPEGEFSARGVSPEAGCPQDRRASASHFDEKDYRDVLK